MSGATILPKESETHKMSSLLQIHMHYSCIALGIELIYRGGSYDFEITKTGVSNKLYIASFDVLKWPV